MTRMRLGLLTATTLIAAIDVAVAQPTTPTTGPYVTLGGGYSALLDLYAHPRLRPDNLSNSRYRFDNGWTGEASAGWGLGNGLRLEVEGTYANNNVLKQIRPGVSSNTTGNQGTYIAFGNVLYDIDLTKAGLNVTAVQPYVGVGAGAAWTHFAPLTTVSRGDVFRLGGTGGNFAYQGIAGLGIPIQAVPGLKFTVDYRFIGLVVNSGAVGESFSSAGLSKGTVNLSPALNHQATIGFAYAFNTPAPPAPAPIPVSAPAPAPVRTYLVFFDWDRADLSDRARQIIAEAAQASTRVQTTRIEVNGYTDLSGTARYNQGLSVRRAETVAAELVRDGVPRGEISVRGYGDSKPLVPTAAGVREPQNRRVEILLR